MGVLTANQQPAPGTGVRKALTWCLLPSGYNFKRGPCKNHLTEPLLYPELRYTDWYGSLSNGENWNHSLAHAGQVLSYWAASPIKWWLFYHHIQSDIFRGEDMENWNRDRINLKLEGVRFVGVPAHSFAGVDFSTCLSILPRCFLTCILLQASLQ